MEITLGKEETMFGLQGKIDLAISMKRCLIITDLNFPIEINYTQAINGYGCLLVRINDTCLGIIPPGTKLYESDEIWRSPFTDGG
jgi:hypothetical protein